MSDDEPKSLAEQLAFGDRIAREDAYHRSLGRFVSSFAHVEQMMQIVLRHYTKTTLNVGRAVFSGARTDAIRGYLKRLADVGSISPNDWGKLEPVLEQLRVISDKRNALLHYGATNVDAGKGYVTTALMALTEDRIVSFPISDQILENMRFDCRKISVHLVYNHMGPPMFEHDRETVDEILRAPWRYIPPLPPANQSRRGGKNRAHQSLPESSRA